MKFKHLLLLVVLALVYLSLPQVSLAADTIDRVLLFETNCAGCHPHGGNIIRRGKNLKARALRRNKLDSVESIAALVTHGQNNMPAYQDRLTEREIQAVSAYVLEQAEKNWKSK
ncbi:MAG: c-type cytochrome [Xenococcaceae cyanobacterium]